MKEVREKTGYLVKINLNTIVGKHFKICFI